MIVIHAVIPVAPDEHEYAIERASELAEASRAEPGNIDYQVATDIEDETVLRFFEQYDDAAAFEAHGESDHFQEFAAELPELVDGEPEVIQFEVDAATELDV